MAMTYLNFRSGKLNPRRPWIQIAMILGGVTFIVMAVHVWDNWHLWRLVPRG
jgi:nicotinamide riboside transporter PnuC